MTDTFSVLAMMKNSTDVINIEDFIRIIDMNGKRRVYDCYKVLVFEAIVDKILHLNGMHIAHLLLNMEMNIYKVQTVEILKNNLHSLTINELACIIESILFDDDKIKIIKMLHNKLSVYTKKDINLVLDHISEPENKKVVSNILDSKIMQTKSHSLTLEEPWWR